MATCCRGNFAFFSFSRWLRADEQSAYLELEDAAKKTEQLEIERMKMEAAVRVSNAAAEQHSQRATQLQGALNEQRKLNTLLTLQIERLDQANAQ
jgi:hypothetical protein